MSEPVRVLAQTIGAALHVHPRRLLEAVWDQEIRELVSDLASNDANVDTEEVVSYRILGADETDLANGIIGIASPVARALLGKEAGDEVKIRTPGGERTFEITALAFDA